MKLDDIEVIPMENDLFIVKGRLKYVKIGKNELSYLFQRKNIVNSEIELDGSIELTDKSKEILDEKFLEWGFLGDTTTENTSRKGKNELSMIHLVDINADKFLNKIYSVSSIFVTKAFLILYLIVCILTTYLMLQNINLIEAGLLEIEISFRRVFVCVIAMLVTTAFHEIGHAVVCKKYGGTVTKMGIGLFFLMPCVYCNVNDIYTFKKKREKAFVALAGLYVNSIFTTLALLSYLVIGRGSFLSGCLFLYFVGNIGFIAYNLIPFVKLDGYWFLSAVLNIDNLITKSFIIALSFIFDFKSLKKVQLSVLKKIVLMIYGWAVIFFRPIFWYFSISKMRTLLEKLPHGSYKILLVIFICVIAATDILKFYRSNIKMYISERKRILQLI